LSLLGRTAEALESTARTLRNEFAVVGPAVEASFAVATVTSS